MAIGVRWTIFIGAVVILLGTATGEVWAATELDMRIFAGVEFSDNILLEPDDTKRDDIIATLNPGVRAQVSNPTVAMNLDYALFYRKYAEYTEADQESISDMQRGEAGVSLFRNRPLSISVTDVYERVPLDEGLDVGESNVLVNKSNVNRFNVSPTYRQNLTSTFGFNAKYLFNDTDYQESRGDDSNHHLGRFEIFDVIGMRVRATLGTEYKDFEAKFSSDYERISYFTSLGYEMDDLFSAGLTLGWSETDYTDIDDSDQLIGRINLRRLITREVAVNGLISHELYDSVLDGTIVRTSFEVGAEYERIMSAKASIYYSFGDYEELSREDEVYGVKASASAPFYNAFIAHARILFERQEFTFVLADGNRYELSGEVEYRYERFRAAAAYTFNKKDSESKFTSYEENQITLNVGAVF